MSPLTRMLSLPHDSRVLPLLVIMLVPGLQQRFPAFRPVDVLTAEGLRTMGKYREFGGCNTLLFNLPYHYREIRPDRRSNFFIQEYQKIAVKRG